MTTGLVIVTPLTASTAIRMRVAELAAADSADDTALLTAGLARGEDEAFRRFHEAYFDRLFRYVLVITRGDEDTARDVLQETFTRVVRHARTINSAEEFWRWLTTLARSAAADASRKRRSYWRLLTRYAAATTERNEAPDARADERLQALVQRAVDALPETETALVKAKYERGAAVRDIAVECGLTEKAVESRLVRARREIRTKVLRMLKDESLP